MARNKKKPVVKAEESQVENTEETNLKHIYDLKAGERFISPIESGRICVMGMSVEEIRKVSNSDVSAIKLSDSKKNIVLVDINTQVVSLGVNNGTESGR